jgi:hypothetical protein
MPGLRRVPTYVLLLSLLFATKANAQTAPVFDFSVTLPDGLRVGQVAVAAQKVQIDVGVAVEGRDDTAVVNMSNVPFIGIGGSMPNLYTVGGASLTVTRVHKNLYSEVPVLGALLNVAGTIKVAPFGRRKSEPVHVEFPEASAGNVAAWNLAQRTLAPGRYDDVSAGLFGAIRLTAGTYYFRSLTTDSSSSINVDTSAGPVEIYVTDALNLVGALYGDAGKILVGYSGALPAYIGGTFNGSVLAPNAALTMAGGLWPTLTGSFFANTIVMAKNVRIVHAPSEVFGPTRISRTVPAGAVSSIAGYDPGFIGCAPVLAFKPPQVQTEPLTGRQYFGNIGYTTSPTPCQAKIKFCDANGNVIANPTEAEINADPGAASQCTGLDTTVTLKDGDQTFDADCEVNPASMTTLCSAGCAAGEVCGTRCLDTACTRTEARCGKLYESCAKAMVTENRCQTYHQCADPDSVGTPTSLADAQSVLTNQSTPGPQAITPVSQQMQLLQYAPLTSGLSCHNTWQKRKAAEKSNKPLDFGNDKWGGAIVPTYTLDLDFPSMGAMLQQGEFSAVAMGGIGIQARVYGKKISIFDAQAGVARTTCGWDLTSDVRLFGDQIASWDTRNGGSAGLPQLGADKDSPPRDVDECKTVVKQRGERAGALRNANFYSRAAVDHYNKNGMDPSICAQSNLKLGTNHNCSMLTPSQEETIIENWKTVYRDQAKDYKRLDGDFKVKSDKLAGSLTLDLFNVRQAYSLLAQQIDFPVGPFTLTLAIEGFGFWEIGGAVVLSANYDVGYGDFWNKNGKLLGKIGEPAFPKNIGGRDIRLALGPVVTPGIGLTALAYLGVGIGPVSVGIEGALDLVKIGFPAAGILSFARVTENPNRTIPPAWAGTALPGMELNKAYGWKYNLTGKLGMTLRILDGRINLAARVNLWFWKKTWRIKITDFVGFEQYFPLVEGSLGSPVASDSGFGVESDDVEYTDLPAGTTYHAPGANPPVFSYASFDPQCPLL